MDDIVSDSTTRRWRRRPPGSNWGDFGDTDRIGRLNLLTPERRREAAREVVDGHVFCLSLPLDVPRQTIALSRKPPRLFAASVAGEGSPLAYHYCMCQTIDGALDVFCDDGVVLYPQHSTQWDAFSHVGNLFDADDDGEAEVVYYNGYRPDEDFIAPGAPGGPFARALGVDHLAVAGLQGRGVLIDIKRAYGGRDIAVGYDDLMRLIDSQKAVIRSGDILCLYTGYVDVLLAMGDTPDAAALARCAPGLDGADPKLQQWIEDAGLVAICADNLAVERTNPSRELKHKPGLRMPLHQKCLFKLGMPLGELWYLTELADWLRRHDRSSFLLTAPPLRLPGATGSPVTPLATV